MKLSDWRRLLRPRLLFLNSMAAFTGGLLFSTHPALALPGALAVTLLAAGATLLNQWQEQRIDAQMSRTCQRPLVTGRLPRLQALLLASGLILGGTALLLRLQHHAALLGLLAVLLYNGLYTPLKRLSPLALFPGAVCGALPVLIGWVAAGGRIADHRALLVAGVLFLWQVPHFWLLAWQYRADYHRAGLPQLNDRFSTAQMQRLTQAWLWCLIPASLLLPLFGVLQHPLSLMALLVALIFYGLRLLGTGWDDAQRLQRFIDVNLLMVALLMILILDHLG